MANFQIHWQITQPVMVQLTKFGADWLIFVDEKSVNKVIFGNFSKLKGK